VGAAIEVRGAGSGRLRLRVLDNSRAKTLEAFTKATTAPAAIVHTDGLNSYAGLAKLGYQHRPRKQTGAATNDQLLHRAISMSQAGFDGDLVTRFCPGERKPSDDVKTEEVPRRAG
jgi:hypothetical protein